MKDLEQLVQNLNPQGIRESALKAELQKRYPDASKAICVAEPEVTICQHLNLMNLCFVLSYLGIFTWICVLVNLADAEVVSYIMYCEMSVGSS